ncbi:F-box/kelch-repeat protein At1g57790-like [Salvia splendens]|uniref:F-box/kelch-repeat protein At1g57790-like n=1 Tax=Salvia splendens TaxID=180675 RepID=UPI001C2575C1|nr:F-box/kelch-repeat protein At1g57790-like [Salvia splendens]
MAGRRRRRKMKLSETIRGNRQVSKGQRDVQLTQSQLPTKILEVIFSKLSLRDNIRASAVCREWLTIAVSVRMANKRKTYWLELPELDGSRICCAKDGWLLLYKPRTQSIFFCCPYTREFINLPKLELIHQIVTFSAAPTSPSCILFTIKHVSPTIVAVSTCRPGKTEWTTVNCQNRLPFISSIWNKIVYCQGLFYCLSLTGWLGVYDPEKSTWAVHTVPPPKFLENLSVKNWWKGKFMAEHNGDVFVIYTSAAINPMIYKLDQTNKVWVEMQTLGGMALFANFLSSHARRDLLGTMTNNVYFSKVRFYGKRCVSYSLNNGRYYPRKQRYDWGEQDPFESVWIELPEDLSTFL